MKRVRNPSGLAEHRRRRSRQGQARNTEFDLSCTHGSIQSKPFPLVSALVPSDRLALGICSPTIASDTAPSVYRFVNSCRTNLPTGPPAWHLADLPDTFVIIYPNSYVQVLLLPVPRFARHLLRADFADQTPSAQTPGLTNSPAVTRSRSLSEPLHSAGTQRTSRTGGILSTNPAPSSLSSATADSRRRSRTCRYAGLTARLSNSSGSFSKS